MIRRTTLVKSKLSLFSEIFLKNSNFTERVEELKLVGFKTDIIAERNFDPA
jgi:hypothetical protein